MLTIDKAISKDWLDLNVVINTREMKSKMGLFDAVPRFHITEEVCFDIETRMTCNNHVCDQGVFDSCDELVGAYF